MATENMKFVLSAEDHSAGAFASITRGLQGMESQATLTSRALGAIGVTFSAAAAVAVVKGTIDAADGFNDLSQRVGINIQALAGWQLAANQSGTSIESVAKGIKGLSGYMVDHADRLKAAGVTATDANGAMIQLADIFAAMPDGVEKTALAVQLFGKAGMDMIPMLNLGSKGLAEAQEKAAEYGRRMAELAPQADKFNDLMGEMALISKVLGINIGIAVVPSLIKFSEQLIEGRKIAGSWTTAMWEFGVLLDPTKGIPESLNQTRVALEKLHAEMEKGEAKAIPFAGETGLDSLQNEIALGERRKKYLEFLQRQAVMETAGKLGDYRDARDLRLANSSTMSAAEAMARADKLRENEKGGKSALQRMLDEQKRRIAAINAVSGDEQMESVDTVARRYIEAERKKAEAMDEKHMARMEAYRIKTEGEEAVREGIEKPARAAEKALGETTEFAREAARNMQDAMADGFFNIMQGKFDNLGDQFKSTLDRMVANAMAANLGKYLLGDFGKSGDLGGVVGKFLGGVGSGGGNPDEAGSGLLGMISKWIPKFAEGTDYVPRTGLALVHQGERITKASENRPGAGGMTVVQHFAITGPADRRTQEQLAAMAGLGIQRALARNA